MIDDTPAETPRHKGSRSFSTNLDLPPLTGPRNPGPRHELPFQSNIPEGKYKGAIHTASPHF